MIKYEGVQYHSIGQWLTWLAYITTNISDKMLLYRYKEYDVYLLQNIIQESRYVMHICEFWIGYDKFWLCKAVLDS